MEQRTDHAGRSIEQTSPGAGRKAYAAPHLLEYGSVAKLTQTGSGPAPDVPNGQPLRRNPGDSPAKMR